LKERREQLSELKSKHDEEQNKLYSKTTEFERAKNELQRQIQESQQLDNYRIRQLTYLEERNPGIQQAVKVSIFEFGVHLGLFTLFLAHRTKFAPFKRKGLGSHWS